MPCIVQPTREELEEERLKNELPKAVLCAVFRSIEQHGVTIKETLENLDLVEAGVTEDQVLAWWREHKSDDVYRKRRKRTLEKAMTEAIGTGVSDSDFSILLEILQERHA